MTRRIALLILLFATGTLAACGSSSSKPAAAPPATSPPSSSLAPTTALPSGKLVGLFKITPGSCARATVSGSYFRMVQSGGSVTAGPYVPNADSPCADKTYTALAPGTDGGLLTGSYQPEPSPPFDGSHNGTADRITLPAKFFAVGFALATNQTDPQTSSAAPPPSVTASPTGTLTGDLSALGVAWNGQQFNQGAPKPNGAASPNTTGPTGTYDATTGAYVLQWTSQISGGPFNGFTGVWHLEGDFSAR